MYSIPQEDMEDFLSARSGEILSQIFVILRNSGGPGT